MRKVVVALIVIALAIPFVAFAEQTTWSFGGIIDSVKKYGPDESHGYTYRFVIKNGEGKDKKIVLNKNTELLNKEGTKADVADFKVGKSVICNYKKDGKEDNFLAYKCKRQN